MSANTFTQEQILSGLWIFLREDYGCESPFDPDSRIDDYFMVERIWEELDTGELANELSKFFGFACSLDEWEEFFGWSANARDADGWELLFAPHFTFRGLADFIRERVEPISFEPVSLLGKPCLTAGIFRGIEQLVQQTNPKATRFAPSTPIRERLRGITLRRFWNRLRWMLDDQIPPLPRIKISSRGFLHSLIFKFGIGLLIALWKRDLSGVLTGIATTFALFIPVGVIVAFINEGLCRLPKGIETFGDLSRVLAAILLDHQSEAA